jgi:hypothetical protein
MNWLSRRLLRAGFRRGVLEGSRGWLYVGVTVMAIRVVRRVLGEPPETVYEHELKPGEGIQIRTIRPSGNGLKRGRR